jgi:hypothetical protein
VDVGGGDLDAADQAAALVGGDVRLVAVHGLAPAVPGPARLAVGADAGGRDQRRVHQRACAHRDALGFALAGDGLEQHSIKASADQLAAEGDEGGALGRGLVGGEAAEPAEAGGRLAPGDYLLRWHVRGLDGGALQGEVPSAVAADRPAR